jgi:hypothetical protein
MRLICPHCQKTVSLPDAAAGQPTPCPLCGHVFTPPALAGAALDLPPEAPAPRPPAPAPAAPPRVNEPPASRPVAGAATAPAAAPATSPGTERCCRLSLRRDVLRWVVPIALGVTFLLTFFPWVVAALGGTTVYSQSAWGVAFNTHSTDLAAEAVLDRGAALKDHWGVSILMMLYLLLLLLVTALSVGDAFLADRVAVPDALRVLWDNRKNLIGILTVVLAALLLVQYFTRIGVEAAAARAAWAAAETPPMSQADTARSPDRQVLDQGLRYGKELNMYGLRRTWWFALAVLANLTAAVGIGLAAWLDRRGMLAEPRAEFYC